MVYLNLKLDFFGNLASQLSFYSGLLRRSGCRSVIMFVRSNMTQVQQPL